MSCSVISLPYAIGVLLIALSDKNRDKSYIKQMSREELNINTEDEVFYIQQDSCVEQKYETGFVDKSILIKTLSEHGMRISDESEYSVVAQILNYTFNFVRDDITQPFLLSLKCTDSDNIEETVQNLHQEYALNVQEQSYLNVVNRLQENNMEIEKEEVLEDNTVVLTINIE